MLIYQRVNPFGNTMTYHGMAKSDTHGGHPTPGHGPQTIARLPPAQAGLQGSPWQPDGSQGVGWKLKEKVGASLVTLLITGGYIPCFSH